MMELLSPAGGYEALVAAVQSGADAVYMGFGAFNARRSARNFTDEEFAAAVDYCHLRGTRVFLTLNTLLTDRELPAALETLAKANAMGVDAVLVQDWGLLSLARVLAPDQPLHASTQMSLFTLGGAREAAALGMERVVLARELNRDEVRQIAGNSPVEVEVFGHGALCMSYSGQCEMSAVLGQRSGNRGACAQPCRLPYGVNAPCKNQFPLSLKDNNLSACLQEMEDMGVACVKLEGRMKRPEYVAVVTSIYRRLIDECRRPTAEESRALELAFSRSGFTDGFWQGKKGKSMLGTRPENTPEPKELYDYARTLYENGEHKRIGVRMEAVIAQGAPARLTASDGVHTVTVTGAVPEAARNKPLTAEDVRERLAKTGSTVFDAESVQVALDEGLMLRAADINGLRRDGLEALAAARTNRPKRRVGVPAPLPEAPEGAAAMHFTCSLARPEQLTEALLAEKPAIVYIPVEWLDKISIPAYDSAATELCALLPRVYRTADEALFRDILKHHSEVTSVSIGNLGHLPIARGLGKALRGDFGLNIYNSHALHFWKEMGLSSATVSFELRWQQVRDLGKYLPCEAIVYGRLPLMVMENCVTANTVGCTHGAGSVLTDRTGAQFPALCAYGCRCEIENGHTLLLADKPEVFRCGLAYGRLRFTTESPEECAAVLKAHNDRTLSPGEDTTRGLFYRGVE